MQCSVGENKKKLLFVLHSSKTHGEGDKPQMIKITSSEGKGQVSHNKPLKYCPFELVKMYLGLRKSYVNEEEQFFVFRDRIPVIQQHLRAVLKKLLTYNNINPAFYSTQAFRSGRSCNVFDKGISVETIRQLGRWRSTAVSLYLYT